MARPDYVASLARYVKSTPAQTTVCKLGPAARLGLAQNRNLQRSLWDVLVMKAPAGVAYALVRERPLDQSQILLMAKDKRSTVREMLFAHGLSECSDETAQVLVEKEWFNAGLAKLWLATKRVPRNVVKTVALVENNQELLTVLIDPTIFSVPEAVAALKRAQLTNCAPRLHRLVDLRPELIAHTLEINSPYFAEAVAGSRHLFDASLMRELFIQNTDAALSSYSAREVFFSLMANPNVSNELVAEVLAFIADKRYDLRMTARHRQRITSAIVEDAHRRVASKPWLPPVSQPWEQAMTEQCARVHRALDVYGTSRFPSLGATATRPAPQYGTPATPGEYKLSDINLRSAMNSHVCSPSVVTALSEQLDPFGEKAWEVFWTLLPDWETTLADLADTCVELAR